MSPVTFVLSAFGDEIDPDLSVQVALLHDLRVHYLEFRSAWGTNVKDLDDSALARARRICDAGGIRVSCIGSPIGKTPIQDPLEQTIEVLSRVFKACDVLDTRRIRIFSFYPPDIHDKASYDSYVEESINRLARLTELAAREDCTLMLENDEDLVADNLARCHAVLSAIDSPHLRLAWDGANFVRSGVQQPTTNGWDLLRDYVGYAHIKDARNDRSQRAAGEGDAEIADLLRQLDAAGYQGFLAVEPHPFMVDERGELRGAEGMTYAVAALRKILSKLAYAEQPTFDEK
jgi:sugar phosphate isomerase/epimerase